ncbi:MAG: hypothetical protein APF82_11020 [Sphingomonadales bacterium BRH_c42]|nr:MAG: hypothetical protein APF82_11020 [Sphingomonadales bacterium BRH_c42]
MDREVFLSLLALDSYNRGYNAAVGDLDESGSIGTATIRPFEPDEQDGWQAAGFYAVAYEWNGETVISYRGTNDLLDPFTGWTIGAGFDGASQAGLAIEFYEAVRGLIGAILIGLSFWWSVRHNRIEANRAIATDI